MNRIIDHPPARDAAHRVADAAAADDVARRRWREAAHARAVKSGVGGRRGPRQDSSRAGPQPLPTAGARASRREATAPSSRPKPAGRPAGRARPDVLARRRRWDRDPQSGRTAPLHFGPLIDYRDRELVGNARNIWELNRHQHLTHGRAGLRADPRRAVRPLRAPPARVVARSEPVPPRRQLGEPTRAGAAAHLVGLDRRASSPAAPSGEALFGDVACMWPAVYRHQWMIAELHSVGSSANNHLIGEMAGLFISARRVAVVRRVAGWAQLRQALPGSESVRQYYPSGVNREQAFGYHLFATELLLLAAARGRAGRPAVLAAAIATRLRVRRCAPRQSQVGPCGLLPSLRRLRRRGGHRPARRWRPGPRPDRRRRVANGSARWRVRHPAVARIPARRHDPAVRCAHSERATPRRPDRPARPRHSKGFRDAGLFVMTSVVDDEEVFVLADAGELGYLSIAAHGHADALSFTLAVGDEQLSGRPGDVHLPLRPRRLAPTSAARARTTRSRVDGRGPVAGRAARSCGRVGRGRRCTNGVRPRTGRSLAASHDGYERLASSGHPPAHAGPRRRTSDGRRRTRAAAGEHDVEWRLHLAPHCVARLRTEDM